VPADGWWLEIASGQQPRRDFYAWKFLNCGKCGRFLASIALTIARISAS